MPTENALKKQLPEEFFGKRSSTGTKEEKPLNDFLHGYKLAEENANSPLITRASFQEKNIVTKDDIKSFIFKYNPNYVVPKFMPKNPGMYFDINPTAMITAENLAEFAYPITQFIEQSQPDFIIACDRGGRFIGLTVAMLYKRLYGGLPTKDHGIHFNRISANIPEEETEEHLRNTINKMAREVSNPKILVLDDWVNSGATQEIAKRIINKLTLGNAQVFFGVMRGPGADVSGNSLNNDVPDWHDDPNIIGVDYNGAKVKKIPSNRALRYREKIAAGVDLFAESINAKRRQLTKV